MPGGSTGNQRSQLQDVTLIMSSKAPVVRRNHRGADASVSAAVICTWST